MVPTKMHLHARSLSGLAFAVAVAGAAGCFAPPAQVAVEEPTGVAESAATATYSVGLTTATEQILDGKIKGPFIILAPLTAGVRKKASRDITTTSLAGSSEPEGGNSEAEDTIDNPPEGVPKTRSERIRHETLEVESVQQPILNFYANIKGWRFPFDGRPYALSAPKTPYVKNAKDPPQCPDCHHRSAEEIDGSYRSGIVQIFTEFDDGLFDCWKWVIGPDSNDWLKEKEYKYFVGTVKMKSEGTGDDWKITGPGATYPKAKAIMTGQRISEILMRAKFDKKCCLK